MFLAKGTLLERTFNH